MKFEAFDSSFFFFFFFFFFFYIFFFFFFFDYQPTLNTFKLKKGQGIEYILSWKSKEVCTSKRIILN